MPPGTEEHHPPLRWKARGGVSDRCALGILTWPPRSMRPTRAMVRSSCRTACHGSSLGVSSTVVSGDHDSSSEHSSTKPAETGGLFSCNAPPGLASFAASAAMSDNYDLGPLLARVR